MLLFQFTDLSGQVLHTISRHEGGEVIIPLSDSRTAKVTLNVTQPSCQYVQPLRRMLKVWYFDSDATVWLVFWGIILAPKWKSGRSAGTVEVNAHDQSIWWKKNYLRYGDDAVNNGYPLSGNGIRLLVEAAIPSDAAIARGVKHPGIHWGAGVGVNTAAGFKLDIDGVTYISGDGPKPADLNNPVAGEGLWTMAVRGSNIYETVQSVTQVINGPEWQLRPYDYNEITKAGYYARLDTFDRQGEDKSEDIVMMKGFGRDDLVDFEYEPDGNQVVNYCVSVYPGGERAIADERHKQLSHNEASWQDIGIYERWESTNNPDPKEVLKRRADFYVDLFSEPPANFSVQLRPQGSVAAGGAPPFEYMRDFIVGDVIRAVCRDHYLEADEEGRITQVTLTQGNAQGISETSLTCVPRVSLGSDGSTGE